MFDVWLIISNFVEVFLGGWRGELMKTILLFKRQAVSHKTIPSCLKIEIKSKVLNVASWDFTGSVEANIINRRYLQLFRRFLYSTSFIYSRTPKIIRGKQFCLTNDLSIASTKTKYIKPNTKTQNIFCRLSENLTTFLYTLTGATRK